MNVHTKICQLCMYCIYKCSATFTIRALTHTKVNAYIGAGSLHLYVKH